MPELLLPLHVNTQVPHTTRTEFASPEGPVVCIDTITNDGAHDMAILDNGQRLPRPTQGRYPFSERVHAAKRQETIARLGAIATQHGF
ncbi:MAG TPA: hypothetical protein VJ836_01115 [Candidatus Saccharimonadales bacterium]|nr:hypothetical protein [Candidatus Saccharimonadales bacterium]